jgi:hypothetical protein
MRDYFFSEAAPIGTVQSRGGSLRLEPTPDAGAAATTAAGPGALHCPGHEAFLLRGAAVAIPEDLVQTGAAP